MQSKPLAGVRVVDLTRLLPGAFCTTLLAGLGAEVIKLEAPGEEDPLLAIECRMGVCGGFTRSLYLGKQRVAVDLDEPAGRAILHRLVDSADVLIENHRPDVARRLGLDPAALDARHPRLVHCLLTPCGALGELAERGGHDLNLLAMAGVLSLLRSAGGEPVVPGIQIGGLGASSLPAVQAILAALFARERDGRGQRLTLSVVHNLQSWVGLERSVTRAGRPGDGARAGSMLRGGLPCYNVYETADGRHVALGGAQPRLWREFCAAVERPDWVSRQDDPELVEEVRALIGAEPLAFWRRRSDLCVEPVLELDEAEELLRAAGTAATGRELLPGVWFAPLGAVAAGPEAGAATASEGNTPGNVSHENSLPEDVPPGSPAAGQQTRAVLRSLGLDDAELDRLAARGVIASSPA